MTNHWQLAISYTFSEFVPLPIVEIDEEPWRRLVKTLALKSEYVIRQ